MKDWIKSMFLMLCGMMMVASFTACGGDDGDDNGGSGNGVNGYYICGDLYTNSDFLNDNVWELMRYNKEQSEYWLGTTVTYTLFDSNGLFFPKGSDGEQFWLRNKISVIRVDDNCFYSYSGIGLYKLGASGTRGMELLYQFDAGEYGILGFYGYPDTSYYYTRDGNRLIVDVGDGKNTNTFVISSSGLNLSGGDRYTKYNPNTVY